MADISVRDLTKYYGADIVLDHISFDIYAGQKVGLIGRNGAGKTTLIKLLAGELLPDEGTVSFPQGKRVSITDQIPSFPDGYTGMDVLKSAFSRLDAMAAEIASLGEELERAPSEQLVKRHGALSASFEAQGGYETDLALKKMINGLGFTEELLKTRFDELSGGEKTRINLARIILEAPDIVFLDEPTNHLDMDSAAWLEEFVSTYHGTVLMVSHDRAFLDAAADMIIEIADHRVEEYDGNYSYYAEEKKRRTEERMRLYERQQAEINRLQATADRLHSWGTQSVKMHRHAFSIEKRIAKMTVLERPRAERKTDILFTSKELHTEELVKAKNIGAAFGDKTVLGGVSFEVRNGDRLGIIGRNGAGKTTLLRIILGLMQPDSGSAFVAPSVRFGYLPQAITFENEDRTLVDALLYGRNLSAQEARNRLGMFGFSGEEQFKKISVLSGGERSRLYLSMLMADRINLLVLDEPTNHLDIPSREWIENAVDSFDGTVLFVSHDRYFLTRFSNRILELSDGDSRYFRCGFPEYTAIRAKEALKEPEKVKKEPKAEEKPRRRVDTKRTAKQIAAAERAIEKLEAAIAENEAEMERCATDAARLVELSAERETLEASLTEQYEEWERLSALTE